jgi:acetyl esterase/lipase
MRVNASGPAKAGTPLVLHLHGGAFTCRPPDSERTDSTMMAESGAVVMSDDYPLAPEASFPQTLQMLMRALTMLWQKRASMAGRKSPIFVAGEEAGGILAAGLALMSRDQHAPSLSGQILISPMLDPSLATCSARKAEAGPVGCRWADGWRHYLGTADKASHPYAAPLGSSRLSGLAPALIITAEDDPMRDEAVAYAARLRASRVSVSEHVFPAPTGWPCSLGRPESLKESWAARLRERFTEFLTGSASLLCPDPSFPPDSMKA